MIRTGEQVARWVCKKLHACYEEGAEGIGFERNGELAAGVCYENWNGRSIMCHIVLEGRMTPEYLAAIFHYPFVYLGVEKIIAPIVESNKESIRLCMKMGFKQTAVLKDAHPDGDINIYEMKREECRYLGERYGQRLAIAAACA